MTHLEQFLFNKQPIRWPEDVAWLKKELPALGCLNDHQVQELYKKYSDRWCAGWLILDKTTIKDFEKWLNEETEETEK